MPATMISARENLIRTYRFQCPEWLPVNVNLWALFMAGYDKAELERIMTDHPRVFPWFTPGMYDEDKLYIPPDMFPDRPYTDGWGSVWKTNYKGMVGAVVEHPLSDLTKLATYTPPDPEKSNGMYALDWAAERERAALCKREGHLYGVGLPHGHTFLRMQDLCGYENLLLAFMMETPEIFEVVKMVEHFNLEVLRRFVELEPDMVALPEDLGMQKSLMMSPELFRRFIKPSYQRLTDLAGSRGALIHQHSDGLVLDIVDDLIEVGMHAINVQDLVNGIDNLARQLRGRVAIDLDIDRQNVTVNGTPKEVGELIREEIAKLALPTGGLSLCYQPWSPTPLENVRAVVEAIERHGFEDVEGLWRGKTA